MVRMKSTAEIMASALVKDWIGANITAAVYPCSRTDTQAFTFTHPEFFATKLELLDLPAMPPSPNFFLFIDKNESITPEQDLSFEDENTEISIKSSKAIQIGDVQAILCNVLWRSRQNSARRFSERRLSVFFVASDWMQYRTRNEERYWIPDLFIGVSDGCAGGVLQDQCVNRLASLGLSRTQQELINLPPYCITDHFRNSNPFGNLRAGEYVTSSDSNYAYRFRKLALLSGEWGLRNHPGQGLGGATLFKVEITNTIGNSTVGTEKS
jgi:hypothetical protein